MYFSTTIEAIYQDPCIKFVRIFIQQITFIDNYRKNKLKKLKTVNVREQLKKCQNIFKILWCIENKNMNIHWNFHVP